MAMALAISLTGAAAAMAQSAAPSGGGDAAPPLPQHGEAYGSYLDLPAQENLMFHDGLDADELIGSPVMSPNGARVATVTDLLVEDDGAVRLAVIDPGSALGAGSRHVIVPIERLRRNEDSSAALTLDITDAELRALPTYRQVDNRWEPIR
jgi:hypothetical protein